MKYTLEEKRELIDARPANQDVSSYCNDIGISKASYYKWLKEINTDVNPKFIEITPSTDTDVIKIEVNSVIIHVEPNYNSKLLLRLIHSLKQLWSI